VAKRDPFGDLPHVIRRIYSYVAYRIGPGPDAEDVTNDVLERALRYRDSYDSSRGEPLAWLLGIARRCVDDALARPAFEPSLPPEAASGEDLEDDALDRVTVAAAVARLETRDQDLVALRYGADLTARQIGKVVGLKTNAVEVALHRALARLRPELEGVRNKFSEKPMRSATPAAEARASSGGK
jgi:RNA polymerase sigma-70 factor, ECF subfamily